MAGGSIVRVGHVRRSAGGNGPLLLSNIGGRNSIYSAVCACTGAVCERDGYNEIHGFCRDLTLCSRGSLFHDGQWFHVYCFKEPVDAQKFMERFGGEKFNPIERGRGTSWARWKKAWHPPHSITATRMRSFSIRDVPALASQ